MQFEFAGTLGVPDGRYLARDGEGESRQQVLVLETLGAPSPPSRRRRRPRDADAEADPAALPLSRATAVRAFEPFDSPQAAERWLGPALGTEESIDLLLTEGVDLLNRALFAHATASADPQIQEMAAESAVTVRVGYGSGEEVAAGRFTVAKDVDARARGISRRRRRAEELRPQERVAAVLAGRERIDACEALILRARIDLDGKRPREAALQLRVGLEALLVELSGALLDPGHGEDMSMLEARRSEAGEAANVALRGDLDDERERNVTELTEICERVLRRRRVLRG